MSHPALRSFYLGLNAFARRLGETAEDDYWTPYLRQLRRYRFGLCASLLPPGHSAIYSEDAIHQLSTYLRRVDTIYPTFAQAAHGLLAEVRPLARGEEHPLLDVLTTLDAPEESGQIALLISDLRLIPAVAAELEPYTSPNEIEVVSAIQLRRARCYAQIVVIGPAYWHPAYVFDAPRSRHIDVVRPEWLKGRRETGPVFVGSARRSAAERWPPVRPLAVAPPAGALEEDDERLPDINRGDLFAEAFREAPIERGPEGVSARLFLLAGEHAVFLEATEGSSVHVIDMEEDVAAQVKRMPVGDIEPGMFILLRTRGGGDYVVSVADRLLGDDAARCRSIQRLWKERLREVVRRSNLSNVCTKLRGLKCSKADESNLRYWMSERNIRTGRYEDFAAIMHLVGLDRHAREYWDAMGRIDAAHRRAGFEIRDLLLRQIGETNLVELERVGLMDFELSESVGGSLTAFRVEDASAETRTVSPASLHRPFQPRSTPWRR